MFENSMAWLLLPLGVALGWALARGRGPAAGGGAGGGGAAQEDALAGLSSLANDNADQAIAALSRAADAEPAAVELQLTLGGLFRRRGEIDRAIHLHEAILARSSLPQKLVDAARIELAQDYLKAGLLDRAEALLQGMEGSSPQLAAALELLLDLFEQARDWPQAIDTARRLQAVKGQSAAPRIAQYWCELADSARHNGDDATAQRELQRALDENPECVRASLAQAVLAEAGKDWPGAVKAYWRAMQQDGRYFAEVAPAMERCCKELNDKREYERFLAEAENSLTASAAPSLARARWLRTHDGDVRAYLGDHLARKPSREGMLLWLETADENAAPWLQTMRESLKKSLIGRPRYACSSCGLQPSMLFWQCPRCKHWGTVAPVEERL